MGHAPPRGVNAIPSSCQGPRWKGGQDCPFTSLSLPQGVSGSLAPPLFPPWARPHRRKQAAGNGDRSSSWFLRSLQLSGQAWMTSTFPPLRVTPPPGSDRSLIGCIFGSSAPIGRRDLGTTRPPGVSLSDLLVPKARQGWMEGSRKTPGRLAGVWAVSFLERKTVLIFPPKQRGKGS